jgi:pyruvate/2-oxoglutarate dehydrogenase complex dihydrolipoamide dehydrogenase (E3) component
VTTHEVDVVLLGVGTGGELAARRLARAGLRVAAVESRLVGGECPFWGCTPSKLLIRSSNALAEARVAARLSGRVEVVEPSLAPAGARIREANHDWDDEEAHAGPLVEEGVLLVRGRGRLDGPGRVRVETEDGPVLLVGRRGVVLNTGASPAVPPVDGLAGTPYWTNREAVHVEEVPSSLAVLGGGNIGAELTQVFARMGTRVTLLEQGERILSGEEPESSAVVTQVLRDEGVDVRTGVSVHRVTHEAGRFVLDVDGDLLEVERLLVAAGRSPNLEDIGLETVGLDPDARTVDVDERCRAGERLWAVGDITGRGPFTHVSLYQGEIVVRDLLDQDGPWGEYHAVSRVTFTEPEVGSVGMTEAQAREAGITVAVGTADVGSSSRGWIHECSGVVKVVADATSGVVVGASTVAPYGGEVLGLLSTAVHARLTVPVLRRMHFAYPTFHRVVEQALRDTGL